MKILFDTNIFVSAFLNMGNCFEVLEHAVSQHEPYYSEYVLAEFRKAMEKKFKIEKGTVDEFCSFIERFFHKAKESSGLESICRDSSDDQILADALTNRIQILITGDKDLLSLKRHKSLHILSPTQYWDLQFFK